MRRSLGAIWLGWLALAGCSDSPGPADFVVESRDACDDRPDGFLCSEGSAVSCVDGVIANTRDCTAEGLTCDLERGCQLCQPSVNDCQDNDLYRCNAAGTALVLQETCGDGLQCSRSGCRSLCDDAAVLRSYIGCEYWPTFTSNSQLDSVFKPAVAIANPNLIDAHVTVTLGGKKIARSVVARQSVEVIPLEFDLRLKGAVDPEAVRNDEWLFSSQTRDLAYRLVSDVPVTVHQFNPLLFEVDKECEEPREVEEGEPVNDGVCNSFTNDASLLIPTHALQADYIVVARPALMVQETDLATGEPYWDGLPGFVTVVGSREEPVAVKVRSRAHTLASADGSIAALAPGDELSVMLAQGEVLQLLSAIPTACPGETSSFETSRGTIVTCDAGPDYDLTGTEIDADGPIQVIAGHDCAYVPFDSPACDHLEEALFPLETWGTRVIVTRPAALDREQHVFRVVSGDDANRIVFDPPVHEPVKLDRGEFLEIETDQHVAVTGKKRIMIAQFLVGQGASRRSGDPAMGLAVPTDQYRASYVFLSPDTYADKFVNVIVYRDAQVALDGETVVDFEPIGDSNYSVATVRLSEESEHVVEGAQGASVGLILYGYANYTSYMLPAGLDLTVIGAPL